MTLAFGAIEIIAWLVRTLACALVIGACLPWVRTGAWAVRVWDFPRVQLASVGTFVGAVLLGYCLWRGWSALDAVLLGLLAASVVVHAVYILPYTPLFPERVDRASSRDLRLMIANVDYTNTAHGAVLSAIENEDPDALLLIEANEAWVSGLGALRERYPHRLESVRPDGLGMALWSRVPLENGDVFHVVSEDRPSLWVDVVLENGRRARLVCLHPTPPALAKDDGEGRHDSRIRDAELVRVAEVAAEEPGRAWVVAGDFNDVAWSRTTRLFRRLSGLLDPRVGRGMLNTFHAEHPLLRYPLDHVFVSPGVRVGRYCRVRLSGSDHFGIVIDLEFPSDAGGQTRDADRDERELGAEIEDEGARDARENA